MGRRLDRLRRAEGPLRRTPPRPPREGRARPPRAGDLEEFAAISVEALAQGARRRSSRARRRTARPPRSARRRPATRRAPARRESPGRTQGARPVHHRPHRRARRAGKIDPVLGRDFEIRQVIDILTRRRQNNPILTGEAGVGKTAVVEGFALRIAQGDVPPPLKNVAVRDARPRPAAGRRRRQGRVREPAQVGHRGGQGLAAADHPLHRRGAHDDRRRRPGRAGRRRQPAQAGAGPRRAAHDRRHHLGRVQEVLREGRRPRPPLPGRQGRGADRGSRRSS